MSQHGPRNRGHYQKLNTAMWHACRFADWLKERCERPDVRKQQGAGQRYEGITSGLQVHSFMIRKFAIPDSLQVILRFGTACSLPTCIALKVHLHALLGSCRAQVSHSQSLHVLESCMCLYLTPAKWTPCQYCSMHEKGTILLGKTREEREEECSSSTSPHNFFTFHAKQLHSFYALSGAHFIEELL